MAVLTAALLDGPGTSLALGNPEITPDSAAEEVLSVPADLLGAG